MAIEIVDLPISMVIFQFADCKRFPGAIYPQHPVRRIEQSRPTDEVPTVSHRAARKMVDQNVVETFGIPSGKHTKNYGKSPFLMGQLTINGHFQ